MSSIYGNELYDLTKRNSMNCNVFLPKPSSIIKSKSGSTRRYTLSKEDTKEFHVPSTTGTIRLKHYSIVFKYSMNNSGNAVIDIGVDPSPYDTVWIEFCKACHHILKKTKSEIVPVKKPMTKILVPPPVCRKHYTIYKRSFVRRYVSKSTIHPFKNYPRRIVTVRAHWRSHPTQDVDIFIESYKAKRVKLNTAPPTRLIA
jgi:hypothetical protein